MSLPGPNDWRVTGRPSEGPTKRRIRQHEGRSERMYRCPAGYLTAGIGRNLEANAFSDDEIELMFQNDYRRAESAAQTLPFFYRLNEARQGVIIEMIFQMGFEIFDGDGYKDFKGFMAAVERSDWKAAHDEMLDSKWARDDTPDRAKRLARIFLTGEYDA